MYSELDGTKVQKVLCIGTKWVQLDTEEADPLVQSALCSRANALAVSALCLVHNLNTIASSEACRDYHAFVFLCTPSNYILLTAIYAYLPYLLVPFDSFFRPLLCPRCALSKSSTERCKIQFKQKEREKH